MARTTSPGGEREMDGVEKAATLLITLGPEKSAKIFKHLKEEEIEQLTLEIANTSSVSPQTKEKVLSEFYEICLAQQYIAEGGIGYAKELLEKALGEEKAKDVIGKLTASLQVRPFEFIRKTDPSQLLNFIQDEHPQTIALILSYLPACFSGGSDDRAIQRVLRDVDNSDLALALKGATEEVQNVILNNLSKRLAVMIKEDMEYMGPVRMKDVEEAQQKIVNIIRKLEDSAEIVIARGGGDEIIV